MLKNKKNSYVYYFIALILFAPHAFAAAVIDQISPQQVAKNRNFSFTVTVSDAGSSTVWKKVLGPDWVNINGTTGEVYGTTPNEGEAHYVQIKLISDGQADIMTFILIVGSQTVYWMDGSGSNPATLTEASGMMSAGDVLIIPDGTYTGNDNTINGNANSNGIVSGTTGNFTTFIAENPGEANFPSIYLKGGEYIAYKGLELSKGLTVDGALRFGIVSNHVKVMMSSAMSGGFNSLYGSNYVLFEDVFAYGDSRAVFRVGSTGSPSNHIIFRRCVARHDFTTNSNPTAMMMQYGGENILFQNCIAIDQSKNSANFAAAYDHYGAWETKNGSNIYIKDSIALNLVEGFYFGDSNTDNIQFSNSIGWDIGVGSTARSPNTTFDNMTFGNANAQNTENFFDDRSASNSVFFTDSIFHDIEGTGTNTPPTYRAKMVINNAPESANNLFNPIQNDITIGATTGAVTGVDPVDGMPGNGTPGIRYPIKIESSSDAANSGVGATVEYRRGTSGTLWGASGYDTLSADSLWPWPNENQIKTKMGAYSYNSGSISVNGDRGFASSTAKQLNGTNDVTLTSYIWEYLGNQIPCDIYSTCANNPSEATVTPSAGANGSISPNTAQTVTLNTTIQFIVSPATDYTASMGGTCGGNLSGNTYTTNTITENCTVEATFALTDTDDDGLADLEEQQLGTNPNSKDTDNDGLEDGWEVDNRLDPLDGVCADWVCKGGLKGWRHAIPLTD